MKFVFDKKTLVDEISVAQKIIATKNNATVFSNVYLEAGDNVLTIKAADSRGTFQTKNSCRDCRKRFCDGFLR